MCGWCDISKIKKSSLSDKPIEQWGLTMSMCRVYLDLIVKELSNNTQGELNYRDDYAKLYSVLMDKPLIRKVLDNLGNTIINKPTGHEPEINWLRFSSILTYYEKKCWFPDNILLPMGVLSNEDFNYYIRRGYVLKDYGAGVKHGEFTHRLQWHVIMSTVTDNFTKPFKSSWQHTPFELYTSLGRSENQGFWSKIFDQRGEGNFNHPDSFHQWLLNSAPDSIKLFLTKRETKRRDQFIKDIYKYIEDNYKIKPSALFDENLPYSSHEEFKKFETWFVTQLRKQKQEDEVKTIYDNLSNESQELYLANKMKVTDKNKYRKIGYFRSEKGNVYTTSETVIMDEKTADNRARQSRTKLF
jgi:hypothetical protein